ncbi:hypothetical protein TNCV_2157221 [Trichonephila clavipes]|nr:hypothetical protein TNCV_2157221 [Trichonephila clavipes]
MCSAGGRTTPAPMAVPSDQYSGMSLSASDVIVPVPSEVTIELKGVGERMLVRLYSSEAWPLLKIVLAARGRDSLSTVHMRRV